jgi:serine protease Do
LSQTVSAGIVSAVGRGNVGITDYEDFIQTDAAVNPGNSGGPLIDLQGRVVGINTAIASRTGGSNGIAFAVPVNMAKRVVAQLLESGKVTRAHLGVVISDLSEELAKSFGYQKDAGVLIQDVVEEGPAAKAGLKAGDIVIAMNGEPVQDASKFRAQIADAKPGADVQLDVWRNNKSESITVRLAELPTEPTPPPPATRTSENVGIAIDDITPSLQRQLELPVSQGAIIVHVEPASAAQQAGLQPGDIIERVGTRSVETAAEAVEALRSADLQAGVRLRIRRGDSGLFVFVRVK